MIIKYLSCGGTEVEEEIIKAEFYEGKHWRTGKLMPIMLCKRSPGDEFEVDCKKSFLYSLIGF